MSERMAFDVSLGPRRPRQNDGQPMRLVLLADFGGTTGPRVPLSQRQIHRVDVDTLDTVMARIEPAVRVGESDITFHQLDDFHPDRLYARLPRFHDLHKAGLTPPNPAASDDLGRLLGKRTEPSPAAPAAAATGLDALIRHIVAPHIVKEPSAAAKIHLETVHAAMTGEMRGLLHDRAFQSLESAWRSVGWLVSRLELDEQLQLHLLDVTRRELLADLASAEGAIARTGLYQVLAGRQSAADPSPWSCIAVLDTFGASPADVALLAFVGSVAARAGGPLIAGAAPELAGVDADASAWKALRGTDIARWIGLAAPRLLLRMPYGRVHDPIEAFPFEECVGPPLHDELLWGNGSVATAFLLASAFASRGWDMEPGDEREIDDLPAYTFLRDGERELQPCAERNMTDNEANAMLQAGLIPIVSRRDRNAVVVPRFQSIAEPSAPLAW